MEKCRCGINIQPLHFKDDLIYDEYLKGGVPTSHKDLIEAKPYEEYFIDLVKYESIYF